MTRFLAPTDDMHPDVLCERFNHEYFDQVTVTSETKEREIRGMYQRWVADPKIDLPPNIFDMNFFIVSHHLGGYANFVAFRSTGDGVKPFLMRRHEKDIFSPEEEEWLCNTALECATSGLPKVMKGIRFHKVIFVPQYDYKQNPIQLHGVIVMVHHQAEHELTEKAWLGGLLNAAADFTLFHLAHAKGKIGPYDVQSVTPRAPDDIRSWRDAVPPFLTRDQVDEKLDQMATEGRGPQDWYQLLCNAMYDLGCADSRPLHPKRLYRKLEKSVDSKKLLELTETAQHTATNLSTSAISQTWMDTLRGVLQGMNMIVPDAAQVIFMGYHGNGGFKASHDLQHPPDEAELCALEMIAQWAAIHGQPVHDTVQDHRLLFQHLRRLLETEAPIVAIPVFEWCVSAVCDFPELHGVFVAIRHPSASAPDAALFTAWTLAAQYFLSPLATAYEAGVSEHQRFAAFGSWIRSEDENLADRRGALEHSKD